MRFIRVPKQTKKSIDEIARWTGEDRNKVVSLAIDRTSMLEEYNGRLLADPKKASGFNEEFSLGETAEASDLESYKNELTNRGVHRMTDKQFLETIKDAPEEQGVQFRQYSLEEIEEFVRADELDPELAQRIGEMIRHLESKEDR